MEPGWFFHPTIIGEINISIKCVIKQRHQLLYEWKQHKFLSRWLEYYPCLSCDPSIVLSLFLKMSWWKYICLLWYWGEARTTFIVSTLAVAQSIEEPTGIVTKNFLFLIFFLNTLKLYWMCSVEIEPTTSGQICARIGLRCTRITENLTALTNSNVNHP